MDGQARYTFVSLRRIRARMAWLGVAQQDVARWLQMDASFFSRCLRRQDPGERLLDALATALGWEGAQVILQGPDELVVAPAPAWLASPDLPLEHPEVKLQQEFERRGQLPLPWI